MLVNIEDITVKKRVRKDLGDLEPLKDSLRRYGLLNPITLNAKKELIAGERRLQAAKAIFCIPCASLPYLFHHRYKECPCSRNHDSLCSRL